MQATQIAKDDGLLDKQRDKKANRFKSKEEIKVCFFKRAYVIELKFRKSASSCERTQ